MPHALYSTGSIGESLSTLRCAIPYLLAISADTAEYDSLAAFQDAVASLKLQDDSKRGNALTSGTHAEAMDPEGKVTLMPVHMSQGREWPVVLVTGFEQPAGKERESAAHEERHTNQLHYVGAARDVSVWWILTDHWGNSVGSEVLRADATTRGLCARWIRCCNLLCTYSRL